MKKEKWKLYFGTKGVYNSLLVLTLHLISSYVGSVIKRNLQFSEKSSIFRGIFNFPPPCKLQTCKSLQIYLVKDLKKYIMSTFMHKSRNIVKILLIIKGNFIIFLYLYGRKPYIYIIIRSRSVFYIMTSTRLVNQMNLCLIMN